MAFAAFLGATEFGVDVNELESRARAAQQPPTGGATTLPVEPAGQTVATATVAPPEGRLSTMTVVGLGGLLLAGLMWFGRK